MPRTPKTGNAAGYGSKDDETLENWPHGTYLFIVP